MKRDRHHTRRRPTCVRLLFSPMPKKVFKAIGLIILISILSLIDVDAQNRKISVELSVSADGTLQGEIESYVRREFRTLSDVDLYPAKPRFRIALVAINPGSAVAISVLVVKKYDFTSILNEDFQPRASLTETRRSELVKLIAEQDLVVHHSIRSDSQTKLSELCARIATEIDSDVFEPERKLNAMFRTSTARPAVDSQGPKTTTKAITQGDSPFTKEYVGSDYALINVVNQTDRRLTLIFGGITYIVEARRSKELSVSGGRYEFSASVPSARPTGGITEFAKGYRHSWRFFIVRR